MLCLAGDKVLHRHAQSLAEQVRQDHAAYAEALRRYARELVWCGTSRRQRPPWKPGARRR